MPLPSIADFIGLKPPIFLRVLNSEADWGHKDDDRELRVKNAVDNGFLKRHQSPFSFYLVTDDRDFRRILAGISGNRHDAHGKIVVVGFHSRELNAHCVRIESTLGRTKCGFANRRHRDCTVTEDNLGLLCRNAMDAGREAFRIGKPRMKEIVAIAKDENCAAAPAVIGLCLVEECIEQANLSPDPSLT